MLSEIKQTLESLKPKIAYLGEVLDIETKKQLIAKLENKSLEPTFWQDQNKYYKN